MFGMFRNKSRKQLTVGDSSMPHFLRASISLVRLLLASLRAGNRLLSIFPRHFSSDRNQGNRKSDRFLTDFYTMRRAQSDSSRQDPPSHGSGRESLDERYAWKWDHYFGSLPESKRYKIQMDSVALYSVTADSAADEITQMVGRRLPPFATVCDATACIGGNTMSFAKYFTNVTSVEMDHGRFVMLQENVNSLDLQSRVHCVNDDFLRYMERISYFDFIFFDPPFFS